MLSIDSNGNIPPSVGFALLELGLIGAQLRRRALAGHDPKAPLRCHMWRYLRRSPLGPALPHPQLRSPLSTTSLLSPGAQAFWLIEVNSGCADCRSTPTMRRPSRPHRSMHLTAASLPCSRGARRHNEPPCGTVDKRFSLLCAGSLSEPGATTDDAANTVVSWTWSVRHASRLQSRNRDAP
mgnify:CR=1 FL=1